MSALSKLFDFLTGCRGKVRYGHSHTAQKAATAMEKKGVPDLEPYECRFCGGWHIGHRKEGEFKISMRNVNTSLRKKAHEKTSDLDRDFSW